jgi:cytochrome b6-f complex iron-sulfur subunit
MSEKGGGVAVGRRGFLNWVLRVCGAITGVGLVGPALVYVWPSTQKGPVRNRKEVGAEADWAVWTAKKVSLGDTPVIVVRTSGGFRAFSAVCTHLGCLVEWNEGHREFDCPCHAARFDSEGKVIGGPAPRPLRALTARVVQGKVFASA